MLAQFCQLTKRYFQWLHRITQGITDCAHLKQPRRRDDKTSADMINVQTVTDDISRRVTSGRENTSLILVHHGVKVIEGGCRNVMLL